MNARFDFQNPAVRIGASFWGILTLVLLGFTLVPGTGNEHENPNAQPASGSWAAIRYFAHISPTWELPTPPIALQPWDPIFEQSPEGHWTQVGHVLRLEAGQGEQSHSQTAVIRWYGSQSPDQLRYVYHQNGGSLAEAVKLMLPDEKRKAILNAIATTQQMHGPELSAAFRPVIEKTLRESVPVIQRGLIDAIQDHRPTLLAIGQAYEAKILNQRLLPLVQSEILPIVRTHGEPVASEIGMEIWNRASLFRFGWRMAYDKSPLPQRDLTKQEWNRFVEQDVVPVFNNHMEPMVDALKSMMRDIAKNERVRQEVSSVLGEVVTDRQLTTVIAEIVRQAMIDNDELKQLWIRHWQSEPAQAALHLAQQRLEPLVRQIGDEIFGSRDAGISPGFARVLRNQILGKDRRWIQAIPRSPASIQPAHRTLEIAENHLPYPLLFFAGEPSSPALPRQNPQRSGQEMP